MALAERTGLRYSRLVTASTRARLEIAGPWRRLLAYLLDFAIVVVLGMSIASMFFGGVDEEIQSAKNFLISTSTQATYSIVLMSAYSATPGMMALGIYVANRDGSRVQPDAVVLRYLVFFLTWVPASLVLDAGSVAHFGFFALNLAFLATNLGLLFFTSQRRVIHDRVANTVVLRGRPDFRPRA